MQPLSLAGSAAQFRMMGPTIDQERIPAPLEREMNSMSLRTIDERFSRWSVSGNHPVAGSVIGLALIAALVPALQYVHGAAGTLGPSIPLFFLVPVLLSSAVGGPIVGTAVSIVAVTAWDWFFIPPFYTFTVYYPRDVLALVVFLAVALLTGQLAAGVRRRAQEALRRAASAEALYELSTALIAQRDLISVLEALTARLQRAFELEACAILLPDGPSNSWRTAAVAGNLPASQRVESNRTLHGMAVWVNAHGEPSRLPEQGIELLPLRSGEHSVGVLQLAASAGERLDGEREQLLRTFANAAAIAIEQARLAQEQRAAAMALESDRLKTALLSSVSHDLRTPLAGIKAAATSLLQDDIQWSAEDRRAFASDIDAEADRLTRLVVYGSKVNRGAAAHSSSLCRSSMKHPRNPSNRLRRPILWRKYGREQRTSHPGGRRRAGHPANAPDEPDGSGVRGGHRRNG